MRIHHVGEHSVPKVAWINRNISFLIAVAVVHVVVRLVAYGVKLRVRAESGECKEVEALSKDRRL
jgi:hypothetical protein